MEKKIKKILVTIVFLILAYYNYGYADLNKIEDVQIKEDKNNIYVNVKTSSPAIYKVIELKSPDRIVLDFENCIFTKAKEEIKGIHVIQNVKVSQFEKNIARVVINILQPVKYKIENSNDKKIVKVNVPKTISISSSSKKDKIDIVNITQVILKEIENGLQVTIQGDNSLRYKYKEIKNPPSLLFDIPNAQTNIAFKEIHIDKENVNSIIISSKDKSLLFEIKLNKEISADISLAENNTQIIIKLLNILEEKKQQKSKTDFDYELEKIIEKVAESKEVEIKKEKEKKVADSKEGEIKKEKEEEEEKIEYIFAYPEINNIKILDVDKKIKIEIIGNSEILYKVQEVETPPQVILTIPDFTLNIEKNIIDVNLGTIKNISANQTSSMPPISSIIINFTKKTKYEISLSSDKKHLTIITEIPKIEEIKEKEEKKEPAQQKKEEPPKKDIKEKDYISQIKDVNFQKLPEHTVINIIGDKTLRFKLKEIEKPYKFVIDVYNAIFPLKKKALNVNYGGIKNIKISQLKKKDIDVVQVEIFLTQKLTKEITTSVDVKQITLIIKKPISKKIEEELVRKKEKEIETKPIIEEKKEVKKELEVKIPLPPEEEIKLPPLPTVPVGTITIDFKDADVRDVIKIFSEMTGKNIVVDNSVSGKITISLKNVPFQQAFDMILAPNDLIAHEIGDTLVVVPRKDTKLIGKIGVGTALGGFSVETFNLRNYTPAQFYNILKEIMPEFQDKMIDTGQIDKITLIGTRASLDKVRNFISMMQPIPDSEVRTFSLEGKNYDEVKKIIEQTTPEVKNGIVDTGSKSTITIISSKENLLRVEKILKGLDLPPSISYQIFELLEIEPEKAKNILSQTFPNVTVIDADIGSGSSSILVKGTSSDLKSVDELIKNLNDKTKIAKSIEIIKLQYFETIEALQEQTQSIESLLLAAVPGILKSGGKISVDKRTNSIIVEGTKSDIKRLKEIIKKIDVKIPIVRLYVQVIDSKSPLSKIFGNTLIGSQELFKSGISASIDTEKGSINVVRGGLTALQATLSSLEKKEEIKYLTNTELHTFSGKEASVSIRDKYNITRKKITYQQGVPTPIEEMVIEPIDGAGLTIKITPRVKIPIVLTETSPTIISEPEEKLGEEEITLNIDITVYAPSAETPPAGTTIGLNERSTKALLRTKSGESIVITGLFSSLERETIQKVPLLGNIPFAGKLFQKKEIQQTGSEITILITAEVNPTK